MRLIFRATFILYLLLLFFSKEIFSEVLQYTDITSAATISGDVVLIDSSINIETAGNLIINGDLKIFDGKILMGSSVGNLKVYGDLILTNTKSGENATIITHGDIVVIGRIIVRSTLGEARITTTGASAKGKIEAESISTWGFQDSSVRARDDINTVGEISTKSDVGDGRVQSDTGKIYTGSILTHAYEIAGVYANTTITSVGEISTKSYNNVADVSGLTGLYAYKITASAKDDTQIYGGSGDVDVRGDITVRVHSEDGGDTPLARVRSGGTIRAVNILIDGDENSLLQTIGSGHIFVDGDIVLRSKNGYSRVISDNGYIRTSNITTSCQGDSYVKADLWLDIARNIDLFSQDGSAYVECAGGTLGSGKINACSINTYGKTDCYIKTTEGPILCRGIINTKSSAGDAYVSATSSTGGGVRAIDILTDGYSSGYITCVNSGDVKAKDVIRTRSSNGTAYVKGYTDVTSRSINTYGNTDSYVQAENGSIIVDEDIFTKSTTAGAYVYALNGDVDARGIKTRAASGQDYSIKSKASAAGGGGTLSGHYKLFADGADAALTLKDSELYFDRDYEWDTQLSLDGTCTINGNGHQMIFGSEGAIIIKSGSSLMLKNVALNKLGGTAIRFEDDTGTLSIHNVNLTLTSNMTFTNGALKIYGDLLITGSGTNLSYLSAKESKINANSSLIFGSGVSLYYGAGSNSLLAMEDRTSRLHLNGSSIYAQEDVRLINGTLVFDNSVTFSAYAGKNIYFGNSVGGNNLSFEHHLRSRFIKHGNLVDNNV